RAVGYARGDSFSSIRKRFDQGWAMPSDGRDRPIATERRVMLLILIPIVWLTVAVVVVAVCQASARGESERRTPAPEQRYVIQERLVVWDDASALAPRLP